MVFTLYTDPLSQPARALVTFLRLNKIEYEEKVVPVLEGGQKKPEFAKINRFQMIPCIVDGDFHLSESVAIFLYWIQTYPVADHWYPKDVKAQARVNEFLSWQQTCLRVPLTRYMVCILQPATIKPRWIGDREVTPEDVANYKKQAEKALDDMENIWLKDSKFVSGDQISIADLLAVEEIEELRLPKLDFRAGRPRLTAYLARVKEFVGAELYDEIHQILGPGA